jgi:hypothetical protein
MAVEASLNSTGPQAEAVRDRRAAGRSHVRRLRAQAYAGLALTLMLMVVGDVWVARHQREILLYTPPAESQYRVKPAAFREWLAQGDVALAFVGTSRAHAAFSARRAAERLTEAHWRHPVVFNYGLDHAQFHEVQHTIREIATLSPGTLVVWGVSDVSFVAEPSLAPAYEWSFGDLAQYLVRGEGDGHAKRATLQVYLEGRAGALWKAFGLRRQVRNYLADRAEGRLPGTLRGMLGTSPEVRARWARENREIYADRTGDAPTTRSRESEGWTVDQWCAHQKLSLDECMARHAPQPPADWIGPHGWAEVRATADLVRRHGGRLVLVEMPRPPVFRASVSEGWFATYHQLIARAAEESGSTLLTVPGVEAVDGDEYFSDHSHLNTRGQAIFTDLVMTRLVAKGYLAHRELPPPASAGVRGG